MIDHLATLEIRLASGRVTSADYLDGQEVRLGRARPSHSRRRGFLQGLLVDAFELSARDEGGRFQWRLYSERRGWRSGLVLSLAETDSEALEAQGDPLWMVGTLGREGLDAPEVAEGAPDPRTLFIHGDASRVLIDDDAGELWGSLERSVDRGGHTLRSWDGRGLGRVVLLDRDDTGLVFEIRALEGLGDALEHAALVSIPIALALLTVS